MKSNYLTKMHLILVFCLFFSGCGKNYIQPEEVKIIELKKSQKVQVTFKALKADLVVNGGGRKLMVGKFHYFLPTSRTFVDYQEEAEEGDLAVYDKFNPSIGEYPTVQRFNLWTVGLSAHMPFNARIDLKEGQIIWNARQMNLERLEMELGKVSGQFDFVKQWTQGFYAEINLQVGNLILKVPQDQGVWIELADENQMITAKGFKKEGKFLTNENYKKEKPALRFYIHPGQGQIVFDSIGN